MAGRPTGAAKPERRGTFTSLRKGRAGRSQAPWIFLLPAIFMYGLVVIYPSLAGSWYAFTDWDGLARTSSFVGLENFRTLVQDEQAIASLRNTFLLAVTVTIVQNAIGLLIALGVNYNIKSRNVLRVIFFASVVLTPVIVAFLWQYIYAPGGPLNRILDSLYLGWLKQDWLGDPNVALWAVVAVIIWQYAGYSMVIFLAGLQGVPQELYEAAAIDGAGALQKFWNVTRPMIAPAITINLMLSIIGGLRLFDQVFALTGGGPGYATETLSTVLYEQAFIVGAYGYGTAIALVLTLIVACIAMIQLKVLRSQEVEA
jgi:raffinose/stachyose/melibiose transport system permease protein